MNFKVVVPNEIKATISSWGFAARDQARILAAIKRWTERGRASDIGRIIASPVPCFVSHVDVELPSGQIIHVTVWVNDRKVPGERILIEVKHRPERAD